jgi:hypothetical protein
MAYLTHDSCDHQKQPETSTYLEKMKSGLISPNNAICAFEIVVYVQKVSEIPSLILDGSAGMW